MGRRKRGLFSPGATAWARKDAGCSKGASCTFCHICEVRVPCVFWMFVGQVGVWIVLRGISKGSKMDLNILGSAGV